MRLTASELAREAAATGFQVEPLEKAIVLLELLESIRSHPFLKDRLALKGGTALNLFVLAAPRLSVDIDLNYVGAVEREKMISEPRGSSRRSTPLAREQASKPVGSRQIMQAASGAFRTFGPAAPAVRLSST
jgi:hypothetical protein